MAKHIVVCMDGTWNDPTEQTNVYKLFRLLEGDERRVAEAGAIRPHLRKEGAGLLGLYVEGVGARGRHQGPLGGALGVGLHDRVIDAFVLVSQAYAPGDRLWVFGFSRGAWAARSLAGFIARAGLLDDAGRADAAVRAETLWFEFKHGKLGDRGDHYWQGRDPQPIELVGVWDTVGALGVPFFNGLRVVDGLEARLFEFADLDLSPRVKHGRHALAIDETRFDFSPTPWNARAGVVQTWMPGVHGDVGGGHERAGLSDDALQWMVGEINGLGAGLELATTRLKDDFRPDALADRHDEARKLVWQLRPRKPRQIPVDAQLAPAVAARLRGRADYRPAALRPHPACTAFFADAAPPPAERLVPVKEALPTRRLPVGDSDSSVVFAQKWWNAAGLEVKAGERYRITAAGTWTDRDNSADARGYSSTNFMMRFAESSRRLESALWFALIAAVNEDVALELKNPTSGNFVTGGMESFVRGVGRVDAASQLQATGLLCELTADRDGFLYFFANDSAFAYSNNSGYLDVTVSRLA